MVDPTGVILALVCESESPRYHCFQPFLTLHLPRAHGGHKYRFRDANCRDGIAHEFNVAGRRRTLSARVVTERLKLSCIMCQLGAPSHGSSPRSTTGPGVANPVRVDRAKTGCEYNTSRDAYTRISNIFTLSAKSNKVLVLHTHWGMPICVGKSLAYLQEVTKKEARRFPRELSRIPRTTREKTFLAR